MQEWISYFGEIIVVIAVSGVLYTAAPDGKTKKYVHFIISLCVLSATVFPIISLAEALPKQIASADTVIENIESDTDETIKGVLVEASRAEIEQSIVELLCAKFDYDTSDIKVTLTLDARDMEKIEITAIRIDVKHITTQTKTRMKEYLEEMFLGETVVSVYGEE